MDPNPTALPSLVEHIDVEKHRSLSCTDYDGCLATASRRAWRSWTCRRCTRFGLVREMRSNEMAHLAYLRPLADLATIHAMEAGE
jgi:hypothetical protein